MFEVEKPYEINIDGTVYCFQYENPVTRNGGKTFSGVAVAWKKDTDDKFTVPYGVESENIDQCYEKIIEGIKAKVRK